MKILIIGEFSGFSKNLCRGFKKIGHEACAFSWGDSFKRIISEEGSVSINIYNYKMFGYEIKGSHYIRRFFSFLKMKKIIKQKKQLYDCALIINPSFIKNKGLWFDPYPTIEDVKSMLTHKDMIFLSACGNDFIFNSYLPYREKTSDYIRKKFLSNLDKAKDSFFNIFNSIKGVIPIMVDNADAYRKFQYLYKYKIFNTIPLPYEINSSNYTYKKGDTIKIFHGVTRSKEKGSDIIIEALNKISEEFGDKVLIRIVSKVTLQEYLRLMEDTDIVIDQCFAYSYGLNAIEALSMGKVVLSGNEPNNIKEFGIDYCPVINIRPSVNNIVEELTKLINNPEKISEISCKSKLYATRVHDCEKIAHEYTDLFEAEMK